MSYGNSPAETLRVLMMPDYSVHNPYQTLLSKALENQGVEVLFSYGYRRVLPISRAIQTSPNKIDILHLHWTTPYTKGKNIVIRWIYTIKLLVDILLTKLTGVKVVWTNHDRIDHDSKFPLIEQWMKQNLLKLADKIIVHQASSVQDLAQTYNLESSKIEVIPHGHYREFYGRSVSKIEARKALDIPLSGRVYLNLGMLRPYKGIERLLKVFEGNQELLKESILLIAGKALDEAYGQKLKEQAAKIQGVFLYDQFVENSQIHLFFSAADVVVLPFKSILTSGSLILAMSYNKPIIAPRAESLMETLNGADWLLYDPEDEQGLLQALKASTQLDLDKLSDVVQESCDRLGWDYIGTQTQKLYQNLIN
ncbi:glycosyltransferase [Anabaena lutea]|uniref:Glycosyltransferase n=1 Tax=Anabaena lutea FACHB-196 TaxID=2692881 RepID=A0ABR8FK40_9NOST|nr:glycosyltransferase [Anabaena lutea]MBD2570582.1 glycosyltransferase [Anabaena lutea FACHB-196]